ncbi:MAG TPA: signal recognition particle receptor subunit alpha, partial [Kofleriaceae bacterium]|nr:signal recognition particle receptor subunit alpha [Kofleriaceae bacterium]
MQTELLELAAAIAALVLILYVLRRASARSRAKEPADVRERLGVEPAAETKPRRERKRPRSDEPAPPASEAEPAEPPPAEVVDAEARDAYRAGLAKTRGGFVARIGKLFGRKKIDAQTVDELEEVLFTADIGPRAADRIFQAVKAGLSKDELDDASKIWARIRATSKDILSVDAPAVAMTGKRPFVLLVLGVNGVGKTTTIGKLAQKWKLEG